MLSDQEESEREKLRESAEARAKKYGINFKEDGHLTPPEGYESATDIICRVNALITQLQ